MPWSCSFSCSPCHDTAMIIPWEFIPWGVHTMGSSYHGEFIPWGVHTMGSSYPGENESPWSYHVTAWSSCLTMAVNLGSAVLTWNVQKPSKNFSQCNFNLNVLFQSSIRVLKNWNFTLKKFQIINLFKSRILVYWTYRGPNILRTTLHRARLVSRRRFLVAVRSCQFHCQSHLPNFRVERIH